MAKSRFSFGKAISYLIIALLSLSMLIPFINVLARSLSDVASVTSGKVFLIPIGMHLGAYRYVFNEPIFFSSLINSLLITTFGTLAALVLTSLTAYPMSRKHMRGRNGLMYLWIFVMLFNGGIVPNYMLYRSLRLTDTLASLVLPAMLNVFNMLIIKNFFEELPVELEEAAKIDGASNLRIFIKVMFPVATPVFATIGLFYAVTYWNDYFNAVLYISSPGKKPLQLYLYESLKTAMQSLNEGSLTGAIDNAFKESTSGISPDSIRSANIIVSTFPILCLYPFLQRHFVKGMVIGAVKG